MTDKLFRLVGPTILPNQTTLTNSGRLLYTAPANCREVRLRDVTLTNLGPITEMAALGIGGVDDASKRFVKKFVGAQNSVLYYPLMPLGPGETIYGMQVSNDLPTIAVETTIDSGTDATSFTTAGGWIPTRNVIYFLFIINTVTSAGTIEFPSSITGKGSWTLMAQAKSSVAAASNVAVSIYWASPAYTEASGTTTINFPSSQHACVARLSKNLNELSIGSRSALPWTATATPVVQTATSADAAAPGATTAALAPTFASAYQTGYLLYLNARVGDNATSVAGQDFLEVNDLFYDDVAGNLADIAGSLSHEAVTPWNGSLTVPASTYSTSTTGARAAVVAELVPKSYISCMIHGVEVY